MKIWHGFLIWSVGVAIIIYFFSHTYPVLVTWCGLCFGGQWVLIGLLWMRLVYRSKFKYTDPSFKKWYKDESNLHN